MAPSSDSLEPGSGQDYDVALAEQCEKRELEMSFMDALKNDKRLIMYSLAISGTIIMEGYGLALIINLFANEPFARYWGTWIPGKDKTPGKWAVRIFSTLSFVLLYRSMPILANLLPHLQVDDNWQVFFPLAAQIGSIIGVAITSPITRKLGVKKTVLIMLGFCAR